jgi:hypothetical protein
LDVLDDSGRDDVLITEVGLVHPDAGLTLIEASVVVAGSDLVGVRAFEVKYESGGRDYVYVTPNSVELNEEGCGGAPLS